MKRFLVLLAAVCLLLCGCERWTDGSYHHVTPHPITGVQIEDGDMSVYHYDDLVTALGNLVQAGAPSGVLYVNWYESDSLELDLQNAISVTMQDHPMAAYAVEEITWQLGTSGGQDAVAVEISYIHDRSEMRNIRRVDNMDAARDVIYRALDDCASGVVLYIQGYQDTDLAQLVEDYADANPHTVMERPRVVANIYPQEGANRVVEMKFVYQNSRDALRNMQTQVSPVFAAASLYVSGDASDTEKLSQLYAFLVERYDYRIETSITPAYSLLRHGVGDSKAFAMVYAAMCRQAGMECLLVNGTRSGESWYWNLVREGDAWYHVDLLRCNEQGGYRVATDSQMLGYVWDYSAYPESTAPELSNEPTIPVETDSENP